MAFRSLTIVDRFEGLFTRIGVDYKSMRKILELKLTMDARRIPTAMQSKRNQKDSDEGNKMLRSLWMYAFFSLMPGIIAALPVPIFSKVTIIMGISMFLIMSTMISDFSSVLLDIRDKNILLAFPVNSKTLSAAKAVHIAIYLSLITLSLNLLPLAAMTYSEGIGMALLLVVMLVFMVMMVIFLTSLLYVLILKNFDGEKLKDLISSIQIMLTIVMTLGYQVVARMFEFTEVSMSFTPKWWTILLPPTWFAAPFALFSGESYGMYFVLALLGLLVPVICLYLHFKVITPIFEESLVKLNTSDKNASRAYFSRNKRAAMWSALLCRSKKEKAAFKFGYSVLSTERDLKQRIYPSLAMSIVFPFIMAASFVRSNDTFAQALMAFRTSNQFLWVYFSVMILPSLFLFVSHSKYYKGAWIYGSLPIEDPYALVSGTFKSAILKYGVPPFLVTAILMTAFAGLRVIPHMLIAFLNAVFMVLILTKINGISLPFSKDFQVAQDGHMKGTFLGMVVTGILSGLHILLVKLNIPYMVLGLLLLQTICLVPVWKNILKVSWDDIKV